MNTKFDVGQRVTYPVVHTADGNITGIAVSKAGVNRYAIGPKWYTEDDLKPCVEPSESKPEPVKLYCFKDFDGGDSLKRGNVYDISDGMLKYERGQYYGDVRWVTERAERFAESWLRDYLVPLVRRPAKVWEWVLITNQHGSHTPSIQNGAIQFVIKDYGDDSVATKCENVLWEDEYLVLDGYHGDPA